MSAYLAQRVELIRRAYPDGDYPAPLAEHPPGECLECDALRALQEDECLAEKHGGACCGHPGLCASEGYE